jgi:hypothetical protein
MPRQAVAAGIFYPLDPKALTKRMNDSFKSKLGPKKLPGRPGKGSVTVAIVPHGSIDLSGPCAAWAYKKIAESQKPDTIIIIGTNHSGMGSSVSVFSGEDWQTPLGVCRTDQDLAESILKLSRTARKDEFGHRTEHSIEVQLPFLQAVLDEVKFVPVVMKGLRVIDESEDLANAIIAAAGKLKRRVLVIATSDFTHYGQKYNFAPFKDKDKRLVRKVAQMDRQAIDAIAKLDHIGFLRHIVKSNSNICGYAAITAGILFARKTGVKKMDLLKYYASAEVNKDKKNFVGYAALIG